MNRAKVLETMLVLVLALGITYWLTKNPYWLLGAMIVAIAGLAAPSLAEKIHLLWMKLAHGIGFVMNKVILTLVFIFFLLPLSFLSKIFRRNTIRIKRGDNSYFNDRNYTYTKESMENVW